MVKDRMRKITFVVIGATIASPAFAGDIPIPGPEEGIGIAALAALGAGYVFLKKRIGNR